MKITFFTCNTTIQPVILCVLLAVVSLPYSASSNAKSATTSTVSSAIEVNSFTMDNGLHVIHHYRPYSNSVTLQIVVGGGLDQYPCDKQQTPHVLEHMLLAKTSRFEEGEMRQVIKNLGGSINGFTAQEYTHYSVILHSSYLKTGVDMLYSVLFEPALSNKTLKKSITAVHAEIGTTDNPIKSLINDKPGVKNLGVARLYANSNLDCTTRSSPGTVSLTETKKAYDTLYHPSNMTLIILGNIEMKQLTPDILDRFTNISDLKTVPYNKTSLLTVDTTPIIEHGKFSESTVHVNLLLPATGKSSGNTAAFQLISDYLGEVLFNELRIHHGIAYSPRAMYIAGSDLGHIYVTAETTLEGEEKVTESILFHYKELVTKGISEEDITRLKKRAILKFESEERKNIKVAQQIRHHRLHIKKTGMMPNAIDKINALTPLSVKRVIDEYLPQQPVLATLRPLNNNELIQRLLLIVIISCLIALPLFHWLRKRRGLKTTKPNQS
ncbi:MAG: insulinase family protein [Pseudomonadales bacterium]|nr:insulinase family protein [Pseudomonadales bacterium]